MLIGQTDRSGVSKYADQRPGGLGGQGYAQRYRNQGSWLMRTKTPVLKDDICSWIYTINPSNHHQ